MYVKIYNYPDSKRIDLCFYTEEGEIIFSIKKMDDIIKLNDNVFAGNFNLFMHFSSEYIRGVKQLKSDSLYDYFSLSYAYDQSTRGELLYKINKNEILKFLKKLIDNDLKRNFNALYSLEDILHIL